MVLKRYDPATKAAFTKAAMSARKARKSWGEAFEAAKAAGYEGSANSLYMMFSPAGKKARSANRKAGLKLGRKPGRPASRQDGGEVPTPLNAAIDAFVTERVRAILKNVIDKLKQHLKD